MPRIGIGVGVGVDGDGIGIDPAAQAFFDEVVVQGGSTTQTEQDAIDAYVKTGKSDGWFSKLVADYPYVGSTIDSCKVNLKSPSTFLGIFVNTVGGDFASTGWTPSNIAVSHMRTGIIPDTDLTDNDVTFGYYSRDDTGLGAIDMGGQNSDGRSLILFLLSGGNAVWNCYNAGTGRISAAVADTLGQITATRRSATDAELYKDGVSIGTIATGGGTIPSVEIFIGARNNNGTPANATNRECAGAIVASGFTDTDALNQYNARQVMNTSLSRQV